MHGADHDSCDGLKAKEDLRIRNPSKIEIASTDSLVLATDSEILQRVLLVLIHHDAARSGLLLSLGFLGRHRLVYPLVGSLEVRRAG
jgi:hypothetical protein